MALSKTLWSSIVDLVSTGQNVSDNLDTAFNNIDDAIDQIDANTASIAAGVSLTLSSKTADYTVVSNDDVVIVDCSSGNVTITLPLVAGITAKRRDIKRSDTSSNALTVVTTSSELIDSVSSLELQSLESITVINDGTKYNIL